MQTYRVILVCLLGAATAGVVQPAMADTILDNFNRPNAPTLGPAWTQRSNSEGISGQQAVNSGAFGSALATYNGVSSNSLSVDVYDHKALGFVALDLGYLDNAHNLFIKVQDSGGNGFNQYGFYYGDNNSTYPGHRIANLSSDFSSARITATMVGDLVTLGIDTQFNNVNDQTYTYDYGTASYGSGIGLGLFGAASADNFGIPGSGFAVSPEPGTLLLLGTGLLGLAGNVRRRLSNATIRS